MNEEKVQSKQPDEIYCPSCAKPIKKDAVVCPNCGVQIKELKVTPEVIALTPEQELTEGRNQLVGIKVWFWIIIVIFGLFLIIFPIVVAAQGTQELTGMPLASFIITFVFSLGIWLALFIIPLVGMAKRKPFSVNFTRAMLVITMFWFPIGTIIGGVLWKRINHPLAKKYLNYGI